MRIAAEGALGVRGGVPCCGFRCGALYEEQALAMHCTPEVYALHQQDKVRSVQAAAEQAVVERMAAERLRLAALSEADQQALRVRTRIVEEILTLKCPRCAKAFLDFEACSALSCSDQAGHGCGSQFCGFCLALCGINADAHRHVAQCPQNTNPGRNVFGPLENFEEAQRTRRLRLLCEYLAPMAVQQRDRAMQDCEAELRNLGLARAEILGGDEHDPIAMLVAQLRDGTVEGKTNAAGALGILAINAANQTTIAAAGAIPLLILLLRDGTAAGKSYAAVALGILAVANAANQTTIAAAGAIPLLILLLRDGTAAGKSYVAGALGKLAAANAANQTTMTAAGAIPLLILLLRNGTAQGKRNAAVALWNLAANNAANQGTIAAASAVSLLILLLQEGTAEGEIQAAAALWYLAGIDNIVVISAADAMVLAALRFWQPVLRMIGRWRA